jgi:hypothetical protein
MRALINRGGPSMTNMLPKRATCFGFSTKPSTGTGNAVNKHGQCRQQARAIYSIASWWLRGKAESHNTFCVSKDSVWNHCCVYWSISVSVVTAGCSFPHFLPPDVWVVSYSNWTLLFLSCLSTAITPSNLATPKELLFCTPEMPSSELGHCTKFSGTSP